MFPGNPHDHSPCSSTPAGPSTRYGTKGQRTRHGPRTKAQRGLPTIANFGAQSHGFWSRCLRLEVEVTRHRARLASGCWSQLCRAGFDPQGFYERFLNWNSSSLPELHGASFVLALFYGGQQSQRDDAPTPLLDSTAMGTGAMLTRRVSMESPGVALSTGYPWPA